jgi:hypothetical protein
MKLSGHNMSCNSLGLIKNFQSHNFNKWSLKITQVLHASPSNTHKKIPLNPSYQFNFATLPAKNILISH